LQLATNGTTTALTLDASQNATFAGTLTTTGITNSGVATATRFNPTGSSVTGNGIYLPAANSLGLSTNGTNAVYIDSSQNVGIGVTPSATNTGKAVEIGTVGNTLWGIGAADLQISAGTYYNGANKYAVTGSAVSAYELVAGSHRWYYAASGTAGNTASFSESMRIDSSGRVSIGASAVLSSEIIYALANTTDFGSRIYNSNSSSPNGLILKYSGASPNNTGNNMLISQDSTTTRFYFSSNGGLNNYSANNTNLSDRTVKKDIELAPSYLNKICAIPVKTFLYNDQTDTDLNLGVIAQDVQAVAPELVIESNWGTEEEPMIRLSVYQTDLQYALMKSIQELKAMVDSIQSEFDAYKATHP
jgi:hypothetical protein